MAEMINTISTDPRIPHYRFPDQDFLADFFSTTHRHIRYLPYKYNALKKLRLIHPNIWSDQDATNIHYILDKPWTLGRPGGSKNRDDVDAQVHTWWWQCFDDVKKSVGDKGSIRVGEADWKECVEKYMTMD